MSRVTSQERLNIKLPTPLKERLFALAQAKCSNASVEIRQALLKHLDAEEHRNQAEASEKEVAA